MKYRNLEKVRVIIKEATDLDITYAYDDLVFPDHTAFIIQYNDEVEDSYNCYFHQDCLPEERANIFQKLEDSCKKEKSSIVDLGQFELKQKGEEIEFTFLN